MAADDRTLLAQWSAGDPDAGAALVKRHFHDIFRFLQRRVGAAAEDVTQETFEAALRLREKLTPVTSFRAYLYGIARNQGLMHLRGQNVLVCPGRGRPCGRRWSRSPARTPRRRRSSTTWTT